MAFTLIYQCISNYLNKTKPLIYPLSFECHTVSVMKVPAFSLIFFSGI